MRQPYAARTTVVSSNLWYGSALSARLTDGARILQDLFPGARSGHEVFVDATVHSPKQHRVRDFEPYRKGLRSIRTILEERAPEQLVLLGGGCAASIATVSYLKRRYRQLRVIWIDAHGDLHTPESSASGYLHGMALGVITDHAAHQLFFADEGPLPYDRVALVGQKIFDPAEATAIERHSIRRFAAEDIGPPGTFCAARSGPVYVHLDLDAMHPDVYTNPKCDIRAGIDFDRLALLLKTIADNAPIVGIAIVKNAESDKTRVRKVVDAFTAAVPWVGRPGATPGR